MLVNGEKSNKNNKNNKNEDNNILQISDENLKNKKDMCNKCLLNNELSAFPFSCSHNICLICMFKYFISNNFNGLKYEYITLNCPLCQYGNAKFSVEIWLEILNKIYLKQNKNKEKTNIEINRYCNIHNDNLIIKYCNQCKKYLCELCLQSNHKNLYGHNIIGKDIFPYLSFFDSNNIDKEYKEFEEKLRKKENIFYDKIENEYILKKTKIEDLIRRLNQLLNDYINKMNIFQKNMQNIFHIINYSYYIYFNFIKNDKNQNLKLSNKIVDIKFISQNIIDITDISNYFFKKLQEINKIEANNKDNNIETKNFDYEFLWSESEPKKKYILKDKEKSDSILKIIELKNSQGLASCQMNGALNIWDITEKKIIFRAKGHKSAIWSLLETNSGNLISGSSDKTLKIWDIINLKENCISTLKGHKGTIFCIKEIENEKIISGSEDATLRIWDIQKNRNQCILTLKDPNNSKINALIILKQTNFILTGNDDNYIKIWNINSGYVTNYLEGHSCTVWCLINFSEDELLASGSSDNTIKIWDLTNLKYLFSLEGHENTISSIIILKNELLGSSSWDNSCKIWNLNTRSCIYTIVGHTDIVWNIIELKNGDIATCSNDKNIIIWERK